MVNEHEQAWEDIQAVKSTMARLDMAVMSQDGLEALRIYRQSLAPQVRMIEGQLVKAARQGGATWREVGDAAGTSHQNMHLRFAASMPPRCTHPAMAGSVCAECGVALTPIRGGQA